MTKSTDDSKERASEAAPSAASEPAMQLTPEEIENLKQPIDPTILALMGLC